VISGATKRAVRWLRRVRRAIKSELYKVGQVTFTRARIHLGFQVADDTVFALRWLPFPGQIFLARSIMRSIGNSENMNKWQVLQGRQRMDRSTDNMVPALFVAGMIRQT